MKMKIEDCKKIVLAGLKLGSVSADAVARSTFAPLKDGGRTGVAFAINYNRTGDKERTLIGTFAEYEDGALSGWVFLRNGNVKGEGISDLGYLGGSAVYSGTPRQVTERIGEIVSGGHAAGGLPSAPSN